MTQDDAHVLIALEKARHDFATVRSLLTAPEAVDSLRSYAADYSAQINVKRIAEATTHLADAIHELEVIEQTEHDHQHFTDALRESLIVLASTLDVDTVTQQILEYAAHVVPYDGATITQYENGMGHITYSRGYSAESQAAFKTYRFSIQNSSYVRDILQGKPYLIAETRTASDWIQMPTTEWIRSSLGVPIILHDEIVGLLSVDSRTPNRFTNLDLQHLEVFARHAALALKNAYETKHLQEKVAEQTNSLTEVKNRVEAILNNSTDGILLLHSDSGIQQSNATFNRLYDCQIDAYFGKPLIVLVGDEDEALVNATLQLVRETGREQTIEVRSCSWNDNCFDAEFGIGLLGKSAKGETSFVCTIRDITARKAQERQLRFNASLQENVTDAVIATDLNFTIQSWNRAAEQIYGWKAEEVLGKTVDFLGTEFSLGTSLQAMEAKFLKTGFWSGEAIQRRKDGRLLHALCSVVFFRDGNGEPIGIVAVNHDITARKEADEALQTKVKNELEFQTYLKALHEISIELTQIERRDDLHRRVIELGLQRLGFERLALFLYDRETEEAIGTFGTGMNGAITNERGMCFKPRQAGAMSRAFQGAERFCFDDNVDLYNDLKWIGKGWNAAAALWNGTSSIGWLVADNFISHQPASKALMDTLALYAMTVSSLIARRQSDDALRESEARYRLLAENISDVIVRIGAKNEYVYVSPSSLAILGYSPEEMVGRNGFEFIHPDDQAESADRITHALDINGSTTTLVYRFHHKQGHWIWLEATGQVIVNPQTGEISEFIASLRDISVRKRAEEATLQALEKERELGELKSRFVSITSHEFRTPLANIMATTETLSTYRQKMTDVQMEQRFDNIREQVNHLNDIIGDVLQLTRIDLGKIDYNPQPIDLDGLCREIVGEFSNRSDVPHELIYTSGNLPAQMTVDKKLMRQIINNLLSNAIKYTPSNKSIRMTLTGQETTFTLSVADEGIGIPEADLKHMFEPFHRATNVGSISGTGLGLMIARRAVDAHGGTIAIQSKVGVGTTITIEIPLNISKENPRG